jgi:hypothetical protein
MPGKYMNDSQDNWNKMEPFKSPEPFTLVNKTGDIQVKTSWRNEKKWRKYLVKKRENRLLVRTYKL